MKAQITLEYLMLLSIFLVILSFILATLYSIKISSEKAIELLSFNSQIKEIDQKIKDACALGSGNKREIGLSIPFNVSYFEEGIQFSYGNYTSPKSYSCSVEGENSFESILIIENKKGIITLEN